MNLLAGKLYDPGTAVNKVTTALLAMTALDTTNLRLAFVVPPSGIVKVILNGTLHGATTFPTIMLGVLEGSTVKGRVAPKQTLGNTAVATAMVDVRAEFLVTGLTPAASLNWDAAYGVETLIAATGLKYGGPNNGTANDNFGGFAFEIWDPCPSYTPTAGTPPTTPERTAIDAIKTKTDFLPSATAGSAGGVFIAGTNAATTVTTSFTTTFTGNLTGSAASVTGAVGSVTGLTAADVGAIKTKTDFLPSATAGAAGGLFIAGANAATSITTALTANIIGNVTGNLSGSVGSVTGAVGSVTGAVGSVVGLTPANLDAAVSSRMATFTQPTGFLAATFPSDPADQSLIIAATDAVMTRIGVNGAGLTDLATQVSVNDLPTNAELATALGTADDATLAQIALVKAQTDLIPAAPAAVGDIPTALENADALLKRDWTSVSGEASRSLLNAGRFLRNGFSIAGATMTVLKEDDATAAFTRTLTTDAAAEPVIGIA